MPSIGRNDVHILVFKHIMWLRGSHMMGKQAAWWQWQ